MTDAELEQLIRDLDEIEQNFMHSLLCDDITIRFMTHDLWQIAKEAQMYRADRVGNE